MYNSSSLSTIESNCKVHVLNSITKLYYRYTHFKPAAKCVVMRIHIHLPKHTPILCAYTRKACTCVCMQHIHSHAGLQKYVYCITYMHACMPAHHTFTVDPHKILPPQNTCLLLTLPIPIAKMRAPLLRAKLACRER